MTRTRPSCFLCQFVCVVDPQFGYFVTEWREVILDLIFVGSEGAVEIASIMQQTDVRLRRE